MPADEQFELHLPAPPLSGEAPLIPARMVNEFVYCPRLAYGTSGDRDMMMSRFLITSCGRALGSLHRRAMLARRFRAVP